jgi:hypothetical protein
VFLDNDVRHWMAFDGRARVLFVGLASGNGPNKNLFYLPDPVDDRLANQFLGRVLGVKITAVFIIRNI